MVQIQLIERPKELTDEKIEQFVNTFKNNPKGDVWNKPYIKNALLAMFNEKCCYCEVKVNDEGFSPIEHFFSKILYPNEVVTWGNLLLSCTRCNTFKGSFDTKTNPFIHPIFDNPKEHLAFNAFRFIKKTEAGKNSIKVLRLNEDNRQKKRFELQISIAERLKNILIHFFLHQKNQNIDGLNICKKELIVILLTALPTQKFSAITAHFILNDGSYQLLKEHFQIEKIWNNRLDNLEKQVENIVL
jgi:uncharacterized protein (TIGR02646 family)